MNLRKGFVILLCSLSITCFSCGNDDYIDEEIIYQNDSTIYTNDSLNPHNHGSSGDTTITDSTRTDTIKTDTTTNTPNTNSDYLYIKEITKYMNQSSEGSVQGADCYKDYLFQFQDKNAAVYIYNLKEKKYLGKVSLTPKSNNHCNNVSFSRFFYKEDDEFPLIYVSGSGSGTYNQVQVYRITRLGSSFSVEQVQEIILPKSNNENILTWTGVIMDNEHNYMYIYANHSKGAKIAKFNIPSYHATSVTITDKDILDFFVLDVFKHQQGANIKDGFLYVFDGVPAWGDTNYLRVIDLNNKKDLAKINIMEKGFKVEPEAAFFYRGDLFCASNNSGIYKFKMIFNF